MTSRYNVLRNGKVIFTNISQMEYFDLMDDFALEFYQTGTPHPNEISFEILKDE